RHRLASTRYPERETVGDWTQGVPLDKARALIEYWRNRYDWRRFEARANSFPHFRSLIDGLGIHFIHARSSHANAMPIVFTHGWPGSFVEFMEVIGPLTEPTRFGGTAADAFHVVVPSLPGFAFSDKPSTAGWDVERIARAWVTLMQRLGYERWVAQGGDWGSGVTHALARLRPPGLIAAHVNWPFVFPPKLPENPTPAEKRAFERAAWFQGDQRDISGSRRRDLKQSAMPSPTPLPVKRCGSTRNSRRGLTIAVTRKTPSQSTRCLTILAYIGSQILQRRLLGHIGKTPRT